MRPSDRFFVRLPLPIERKRRRVLSCYLLPVAVNDRGRLQMPGDRLVRNDRGKVREKARFESHFRGLELYLLRDGYCELLTKITSTVPMLQTRRWDLDKSRSVLVQVSPWAKTMRINLREPSDKLGQFRPKQGRAHLGGKLLEESPAELIWR